MKIGDTVYMLKDDKGQIIKTTITGIRETSWGEGDKITEYEAQKIFAALPQWVEKKDLFLTIEDLVNVRREELTRQMEDDLSALTGNIYEVAQRKDEA